MFPNSRKESDLDSGCKVKEDKIKLLSGGKTSKNSDSVRVFCVFSRSLAGTISEAMLNEPGSLGGIKAPAPFTTD